MFIYLYLLTYYNEKVHVILVTCCPRTTAARKKQIKNKVNSFAYPIVFLNPHTGYLNKFLILLRGHPDCIYHPVIDNNTAICLIN